MQKMYNVFSSFGGFSSGPTASSMYAPKSEISYDTSSRDPVAMRARVFVGNLNTNRVTRDDVIQMFKSYGTLAGVTLFKGYAFVQYFHSSKADLAVSALNGYNWNGSVLDVKLAAHGMKPSSNLGVATKRQADAVVTPKRLKTGSDNASDNGNMTVTNFNKDNQAYAKGVSDRLMVVEHAEAPDTLICGECRFVTASIIQFVEHRKQPCTFFKGDGEPLKLQCFSCTAEFPNSWNLIKHLTSTHKLALYRDEKEEADVSTNGKIGTTIGLAEPSTAVNAENGVAAENADVKVKSENYES